MRLEQVTITGIDDQTEMSFIDDMTSRFGHVEWGVLLYDKKRGTPRYPSDSWLANLTGTFRHKYDTQFCAHICGTLCDRMITDGGETYLTGELIEFSDPRFFSRVQLNSYPDSQWDFTAINRLASNICPYADIILPIPNEVIRDRVRPIFLGNVNFLFDASRGRGVKPKEWPAADIEGYLGFAGGITPDNIREVLDPLCSRSENVEFWIDMESGVRTNDHLDPVKVEKMLTIAETYL